MTITFDNLSLVETKNGSLSLKITCDDGSVKTLHSLYDPEGEARAIVDTFQFDGKGILVVLGLGLGYHLKELVKRFPDTEIVVIEANPGIYKLAKEHGKISEFGDKVRFVVGYPPKDALEEITSLQMKAGIVPLSIFTLSSAISTFPQYYKPILNTLKNTVSLRLWDKLRYPKFRQDKLRIGIMAFGYFLQAEIERALKALGHEIAVVKGDSKKDTPGNVLSRMIGMIVDFRPDFIISINHIGFDEEGILNNFLRSIEMPVASWYVDSPNLIIMPFEKNVSPYTAVFLWDKGYIKDIKSLGFDNVIYLPLAADEDIFRPMKLDQSDIKKYSSDVGFVGNSMLRPFIEKLQNVPEALHQLVERLAGIMSISRVSFDDAFSSMDKDDIELYRALSVHERIYFEAATLWRATLLYRLSCIKQLREFRPAIHGDDGWSTLLDHGYILKPPIHYYKDLPKFYNACKINFNATSLQMSSAVNQRVFDVPACGSFLLTDHQEAIEELFEVGKEVVTYRDRDEIPEMVRFYLNNPEARKTVAMKGRERVLREHTYKHRIGKIIEVMKSRYG